MFLNSKTDSQFEHAIDNYDYDRIVNLKQDLQEEIDKIEWTAYGKVKSITRLPNSTKDDLEFLYNPFGHRIAKIAKPVMFQMSWYQSKAT